MCILLGRDNSFSPNECWLWGGCVLKQTGWKILEYVIFLIIYPFILAAPKGQDTVSGLFPVALFPAITFQWKTL